MENLLFILATSFVLRYSGQRKFRSNFIGKSGCSALLLSGELERTRTASGDDLYYHETTEDGVTYGMICVDMKEDCDLDTAARMLKLYIRKLKAPLHILYHTGVSDEADWNSTGSLALVDYWQDALGRDWKIKGYTNGRSLAVLYVKNIGQVEVRKQDLFLDGFHFGIRA